MAQALCKNITLTHLDISKNGIGNEVGKELAEAFAEILSVNTTLTSLRIEYNNIGLEGGKALTEALNKNKNTKLKFLSLYYDYKVKYKKISGLWKLLSHEICSIVDF
ncbi:Protein NLRC3 [Gigaspora margarita]|uniref:Protein NLRC3 n=1 Tax=Gigaspora margarita TaxID=4874 RepID=A0A8H4AK99_GIGMA|nr:Protein NLRC3 [Gigaspora margarita]